MRPARILVIRGGAIGDFVVTLPALRALRARWPDAHLEVWGYPHVAQLALRGGLATRVESLDRAQMARFFSWRPSLAEEQIEHVRSFDVVVCYLHDPDGVVADNLRRCGAGVVLCASPMVAGVHAVDHFLAPLASLAIYEQGAACELPADDEARRRGGDLLAARGLAGAPVVLHPGSGGAEKNWPWPRFVEAAQRLAAAGRGPVVFLSGEADADAARAIAGAAPGIPQVTGLELPAVADLLSVAAGYLGNDAGITHLAAALGVPTLALFGPTDPALWAPRGRRVRVLAASDGDLNALPVDAVVAAFSALLDG